MRTSLFVRISLFIPFAFPFQSLCRYLLEVAAVLRDQYEGDIPDSVEELCKLKGVGEKLPYVHLDVYFCQVGPKMAHLCMNIAWGKQSGIGVDVHVHRSSTQERKCQTSVWQSILSPG